MSTKITDSFGEKENAKLRRAGRYVASKLVALLDIDQSTLSKIEREERKPNAELLIEKLSAIFSIDKKNYILALLVTR